MVQQLQALASLSEDLGLAPSIHMDGQQPSISPVLGIQHLPLISSGTRHRGGTHK